MSSNLKSSAATGRGAAFVPERRFPEFQDAGAWEKVSLGSVASISTKKVGDKTCVPMSITSGVGLVSQMEKFGRIIAGDSYKNYLLLQNNEFAYNKSATKEYPEGFIALYTGEKLAAVPNSIFTCFRIKGEAASPKYLNYLFLGNLHGRWMRKFIEVGARAHGSLSINNSDLLALPVPVPAGPTSLKEQQKIADCLESADALIEAQGRKVEALKAHKKGLMQQLFPQEGETQPRLRFPEFEGAGEWDPRTVGSVCTSFSGGTPSTSNPDFYGGDIPFIRSAEIGKESTELFLTLAGLENSAAKMVKKGDVLVALYGANSGDVAIAKIAGAINQAILCLRPSGSGAFLSQFLTCRKDWIIKKYLQGGQGNLSGEIVKSVALVFPSPKEQQRIADCLTSLDNLITTETRKLDTLKTHKKGLMQQIFPLVGEAGA
jgi:type I restriction enzyme S subunit